ncbi:P-II family nitrogen regulator [Desulfosporosinus meridiei]|uniref:Nitrogen regulatory protein PII n=1 Tax=Desulfosporosinus meridiei (strain ATCC BAA-275 / DSM 13257 / KCTC 12902 / NCIMB 13706 / S10) TaxID=768704 RepID=J7J3Q7_DESMD|nr:P-II family nitrogen regulator [Desulfosporosinus meridiei]AFQ45903.1 nitrogen regulatory protein PII [Desulfosporosinus meridiei DSM 13257]
MKKIECIVRPQKLEAIQTSLRRFGIRGMTLTNALGCGLQKGRTEVYRSYTLSNNFFLRTKIEIVVTDDLVNQIVEVISQESYTGEIGDGKVFISNVENTLRILSGDSGKYAI